MRQEIACAIQAYLAGNHDPSGGRCIYRIRVKEVRPNGLAPDGEEVSLEFRFVRGGLYCCTELECHFHLWNNDEWQSLRQQMHKQGVSVGYPMAIRVDIVVEAGAVSSGIAVTEEYCYGSSFAESPEDASTRN